MIYIIKTPDSQVNKYKFDSKYVFYSIGENYLGIATPEIKFLIYYDIQPIFIKGETEQNDMLIIITENNLNVKESNAIEKYKVEKEPFFEEKVLGIIKNYKFKTNPIRPY